MQELMEGSKYPKTSWQVWWKLLRPHTLTAAFIPVVIGTALALELGEVNWLLFAAMLIASLLIQSATNMFNEYYDYKRGLDTAESVGIGGAIVREGIDAKFILKLAFIFFASALALGIYICINSSWWIGAVGIISMAAGYFYTGGPYPIAYSPFGELVAGLFMGLIIILIAFYIQTGTITLESILISIPISILCGAILTANNIRDLEGDKRSGRRTIAILLGHHHSIHFLAGMFIVSYLWIIGMILFVSSTPFLLLSFLSISKAVEAVKGFVGKKKPIEMMPAMKATAQTHTSFGFLAAVGLLLGYFI
ncbi:1,4-dihydroxy-2-naphthoate polyprenyltransferase [Bacillus taeanensis]|uniref:1,4-dihydroxy-2-naphthoate octaprenyltransferase n=1 Tax=Bacillus taeanensis TaxID=273032 RepID=A0A366Y4J6_9BACI|nr:1,4-dihydroxy-2-naphthoate polyprenyltransferase [Bacillus taeanensis]RBW71333.1 1,4-dihydroxy-2-naphthoate octaprenyltransferase [Bacillus taeanensis]